MTSRFVVFVVALLLQVSIAQAQTVVGAPSRQRGLLESLARQIEPDLVGKVERLPQYIEFFRSQLANDTRLFAFDVEATELDSGQVSLEGFVEFPQTRTGLVGFLAVLGFDVADDQLETLPSVHLGERAYGLVKISHTLCYERLDGPRVVGTDCLLGEPLFLLREVGDWLLVHSGDGYVGYVAAADVHRVDASAFSDYPTASAVRMISDYELEAGLVVPTGALLKKLPTKKLPSKAGTVSVALPTGATAEIPSAVCQLSEPPAAIDDAIEAGEEMIGTRYFWGGKTSAGIDCSGLVQVSFATTGVHLPRDANQQFLVGQLVATRWNRAGLRRGDTLYFLGDYGRIRHTALYLGDDRFLHAIRPKVTIGSFNPDHIDYDPTREASFAFGKRLWQ